MDFKSTKIQNILIELDSGNLSVLESIGAKKLKDKMKFAGVAAGVLAKIICVSKDDSKLRGRAIVILKFLFPSKGGSLYVESDSSIVIGFNHPSLGEIFRLLRLGFEAYPDREFFFPVNLPWYEALIPSLGNLRRLGITLVPMITPSTSGKLQKLFGDDSEKLDEVRYLKNMFERNYMRKAADFASRKSIIVVAPSATRQEKIISDHIHPTMTLLSHIIYRKHDVNTSFLPVAIIKPKGSGRLINPFRIYKIIPCQPFFKDEVTRMTDRSRDFDYAFLKRIEESYNKNK